VRLLVGLDELAKPRGFALVSFPVIDCVVERLDFVYIKASPRRAQSRAFSGKVCSGLPREKLRQVSSAADFESKVAPSADRRTTFSSLQEASARASGLSAWLMHRYTSMLAAAAKKHHTEI